MGLIFIYFVYGLAFFLMGFVVLLEALHTSIDIPFARAMWPLVSFGIIHGIHEWLDMFFLLYVEMYSRDIPLWTEGIRVTALGLSFASLLAFSLKLLSSKQMSLRADFMLGVFIFCIWVISILLLALFTNAGETTQVTIRSWLLMSDAWSRYSMALPGSIIGGYALWKQAWEIRSKRPAYAYLMYIGATGLLLYGIIGQTFVPKTDLVFSQFINAELFDQQTGIPIQLVRALLGGLLVLAVIPALNMFQLEREHQLSTARQQIQEELKQREKLRRDMLKHLVRMQEEERSRIGREIHDEIGQTLTAISIGLQQVKQQAKGGDVEKLESLRQMTMSAVSDLDHLITDLRPRHIDHLGLVPAIRLLIKQYRERFGLSIKFQLTGQQNQVPSEVNLAVFRIIQESLTNVVRHAKTTDVSILLDFGVQLLSVDIIDQGVGFDNSQKPKERWGLLGMEDRAEQLGGELTIRSQLGDGTSIHVMIPYYHESKEESVGREDTYYVG